MLLYGPEYEESILPLKLLSLAYFAHTAVGFTGFNLVAAGLTKLQLAQKIVALAVLVFGITFLMPKLGIVGAAIAALLAIVISNTINIGFTIYYLGIHPFDFKYLKSVFFLLLLTVIWNLIITGSFELGLLQIIVFSLGVMLIMALLFFSSILFDEEEKTDILKLIKTKK